MAYIFSVDKQSIGTVSQDAALFDGCHPLSLISAKNKDGKFSFDKKPEKRFNSVHKSFFVGIIECPVEIENYCFQGG